MLKPLVGNNSSVQLGHIPQHAKSAKPAPTALQAPIVKPEKDNNMADEKGPKSSFKPPNVSILLLVYFLFCFHFMSKFSEVNRNKTKVQLRLYID